MDGPSYISAVLAASSTSRLADVLPNLPRAHWTERNQDGDTLLHYACKFPNVAAVALLLTSGLLDMDARNLSGYTPAHYAARHDQLGALEVLCAAGADLRVRNSHASPIDLALWRQHYDCACVLVANGVRLRTVGEGCRHHITPELEAFERGVLRCRTAVVAMLRVKRAGQLVRWDKFLLLELAVCTWSTRYDKEWQLN